MDDKFNNNGTFKSDGGDLNLTQGTNAIGKQNNLSTVGDQSPAIVAGGNVAVNYGISPEVFAEYAGKLTVTDSALASFFKILEEQQVPRSDLDSKLREIAGQYKELLLRMETVQSEDPQVVKLKGEARQAVKDADYDRAEELLNQAEARDVQAIEELEQAARQRRISAAASCAENAQLQEVQLRYAKAAEYCQKVAALLPEDQIQERANCLGKAGYNLHRVARYAEALPLYEQSLILYREIDDWVGEGISLNNISQIYDAKGDYHAVLKYLKQSLSIVQKIGDKKRQGIILNNIGQLYQALGDYSTALTYLEQSLSIYCEIDDWAGKRTPLNNIGQIYQTLGDYTAAMSYLKQSLTISQNIDEIASEGVTLNNIGGIYKAQGDYAAALTYLEQSLVLFRKIGDKAGEGATLNNLATTAYAKGDSRMALTYLEQSLTIMCEIGAKADEAVISWNIGSIYQDQGDMVKAEQYISRAVQLEEEIGLPNLDRYRKELEAVRAKLKAR